MKPINFKHIALNILYKGKYLSFLGAKLKEPVFIIGCGRSGTTMLMKKLSAHPDIAVFPTEANDLWNPKSYPWWKSNLKKPPIWVNPIKFSEMTLNEWTPNDIKYIRNIFGAYQTLTGRKVFLNKSAIISFYIPHLIQLFPNLRLIHIYRDGRAVAYSYAKKQYQRINEFPEPYKEKGYYFSFEELLYKCSETWSEHILEIEKQKRLFKLTERNILYELSYEDFCTNPGKYLKEIYDFLNIEPQKPQEQEHNQIKNMNFKFESELSIESLEKISKLMEEGLQLKGYPI